MTTPSEPRWSGNTPAPVPMSEQSAYPPSAGGSIYAASPAASENPAGAYSPPAASSARTTEVAKEQVANVAQSATGAVQQVGGTAKEQVASVASETKEQARQLADRTKDELSQQATTQRDRAVSTLRSLGDELKTMAQRSDSDGLGAQLARQAGGASHQVAGYLDQREPGQLIDELRGLARRRPGAFLLGAALAGVVAGRLTRGITSGGQTGAANGSLSGAAGAAAGDPTTVGLQTSPDTIDLPAYAGETPYSGPAAPFAEPFAEPAADFGGSGYSTGWAEEAGTRTEQGPGPVPR